MTRKIRLLAATSPTTATRTTSSTKNKKPNKPQSSSKNSASITDKLGKDGKLTPQERQRRFDNNLCMFCGGPGQSAKDCLKSLSFASKAKVKAIQAKGKEAKESSDSKKD